MGLINGGLRNLTELNVIPDSGVFRWTFDTADISGSTLSDSWNSNDLTLNGVTTGVSGANQTYTTNEAGGLDGTDDDATAGTGVVDTTTAFSAAFWYRPEAESTFHRVINTNDNDNGFTFLYDVQGLSRWEFRLEDADVGHRFAVGSISLNTWYHIVFTFDGSNAVAYKDASQTDGGTASSGGDPLELRVGSDGLGGYFDGQVDDVRWYDKALTSTEVSNLYNNGDIRG